MSAKTKQPLTEASCVIVEYAEKHGVKSIKDLPGPWFVQLDEKWAFAVNGHRETAHVGPEGGMDIDIPPYHFAVWRNGWLFGLFTPFAGTFMGEDGKGEDEFIDMLKNRIENQKGTP